MPEGVTYEQIHARMREDGFVIYAGQGELGKAAFRVANMGQIPDERLDAFGPALKRAIS
jgi:2-aminoethylphosphonate-pyruvate transaminase